MHPQDSIPARAQGTWDIATLLMTGLAAAGVAAAIATVLHGGVAVTVAAALVVGSVVGGLAGYTPLHERDAALAERELEDQRSRAA